MKIKVIGKKHVEGISKKTGKPFDFTEVHFLGKAPRVEGVAALTCNVGADMYPFDAIVVNGEYMMERDNGYVLEFTPCR